MSIPSLKCRKGNMSGVPRIGLVRFSKRHQVRSDRIRRGREVRLEEGVSPDRMKQAPAKVSPAVWRLRYRSGYRPKDYNRRKTPRATLSPCLRNLARWAVTEDEHKALFPGSPPSPDCSACKDLLTRLPFLGEPLRGNRITTAEARELITRNKQQARKCFGFRKLLENLNRPTPTDFLSKDAQFIVKQSLV